MFVTFFKSCAAFVLAFGINIAVLNDSHADIKDELSAKIDSFVAQNNIVGATVGIWIGKDFAWTNAIGQADSKTQEKMTLDHRFRIASISKTFISAALLILQDQGKISISDPITKYLDFENLKALSGAKGITLKNLANMTSGIPSYTENAEWIVSANSDTSKEWTVEELFNYSFAVKDASGKISFVPKMEFKTGAKWHYSDTNYLLLGLVIEKASGVSLHEFIAKNIIMPLKMKNTVSSVSIEMPQPFAHGYTKIGYSNAAKYEDFVDTVNWDISRAYAAGHMSSNLQDMHIWAKALGEGKLISKKSLKDRNSYVVGNKKDLKYGLGVVLSGGWIMHTGSIPGYSSVMAYLPNKDITVVCLLNSDDNVGDIAPAKAMHKLIADIISPKNIPFPN